MACICNGFQSSYMHLCLSYPKATVHKSNAIRVFGDNSYTFPVGLWSHLMYLSMNFLWNSERMVSLMNVLSYRQQTVGKAHTYTWKTGTQTFKAHAYQPPQQAVKDHSRIMCNTYFEYKSCEAVGNSLPQMFSWELYTHWKRTVCVARYNL